MREPAHLWVPLYQHTNGDLTAKVGAQVGLTPDPEQQVILDAMFAEDEPGKPLLREACVIAPRQNLKTPVLQIAALADLFVFRVELVIWTAHLFDTAQKAFQGMASLIGRTPEFKEQCRWPPRTANEDESIELLSGQRIEFHARKGGAG